VLRDEQMALRAFVNLCRHRPHPVVVGGGNCPSLECTYLGWVYGLDGGLRAIGQAQVGIAPPPALHHDLVYRDR
jgi:phenylpropionate dioxygenase-like ring-hydroxylating dioxygenase large terminal subunit